MSELTLTKLTGGVLVPLSQTDADTLQALPLGATIHAKASSRRNLAFHRRFFALLNLTFDYWQPVGGVVSRTEQETLGRFVRYLAQYGGNRQVLDQAREAFVCQLADHRASRFGEQAEKSFEVMRKWLTVEAGYYTVVTLPDGSLRKEAKSVRFSRMDQAEFADLYRAVFEVCWRYVLCQQFPSEDEAENAVSQLMGFAC